MICNIFSNLSFIGPFLGNCHCRKLGPSIEKFLVSLVSPSGRLPSSVKDQLACWLSRILPFCVSLFSSSRLRAGHGVARTLSSLFCSFRWFRMNHLQVTKVFVIFMLIILNQYLIKISSQKWNDFFLFSKYLLWIGSFYKKFLIFKVSVGLAPVELLNSPLLVSINVFAHFCRWMSSHLREINTCQIILKFWIKDKCQ